MGYMTQKFKGKYRLKAPIDNSIGNFARDENGKYIEDDVYIDCGRNGKIYHYGGSTMEAWVGDIIKNTNKLPTYKAILKRHKDIIDKEFQIFGDREGSFRFNVKYIDIIAKEMKAKIGGKNISPFSKKNLPKDTYSIPNKDLEMMKKATEGMEIKDILNVYRKFGKENNIEPNKIAIHKNELWNALVDFIGEFRKE